MKCKICGGEKKEYLFQAPNRHGRLLINGGDKYIENKCNECGVISLQIKNRKKINDSVYDKDYFINQDLIYGRNLFSKLINLSAKYSFKKKEDLINKYFKNDGKKKIGILDIGSGDGWFLNCLNNDKYIKEGIETSKRGYELCKQKGINTYNKKIEEIDFDDRKYDVATMWHVLEHLDEPTLCLKKIHGILEKNGLLVISTPNTNSLGFKFGKERWFHLDCPRHLYLYNRYSINILCKLTNFEIINYKNEYYDYYLDLFWSLYKKFPQNLILITYPLLKLFSQEIITVVCKKI